MKKYFLCFLLSLFLYNSVNAQYIKKEYLLGVHYAAIDEFNFRLSFSRNSDFEGAKFIFVEFPALTFAVFQNPHDKSELLYSLNPVIWLISTLTNPGGSIKTGGGMPLVNTLLQAIPNFKLEINFYNNFSFVVGLDTDFLLAEKTLGLYVAGTAGIKYQVDPFLLKLQYNGGEAAFIPKNKKGFYIEGVRLDLAYDLSNWTPAKFIYHCGETE